MRRAVEKMMDAAQYSSGEYINFSSDNGRFLAQNYLPPQQPQIMYPYSYQYTETFGVSNRKNSDARIVAGILNVINGMLAIPVVLMTIGVGLIGALWSYYSPTGGVWGWLVFIIAIIIGILALSAFSAAYNCFVGKGFGMTLIYTIIGMFAGAIFFGISVIFGIIAIILIVIGRRSFKEKEGI